MGTQTASPTRLGVGRNPDFADGAVRAPSGAPQAEAPALPIGRVSETASTYTRRKIKKA